MTIALDTPEQVCGFCDGEHESRNCPKAQSYIRHEQEN